MHYAQVKGRHRLGNVGRNRPRWNKRGAANVPTTAVPTAAIPTTAVPTTAIPTTTVPTTASKPHRTQL